MRSHDTISIVMLSIFIVVVFAFIVAAFRTGKAYYGQPMLYIERSKHPIIFWGAVAFMAAVLIQAAALLVAEFSN
jgi:hypothetical protein